MSALFRFLLLLAAIFAVAAAERGLAAAPAAKTPTTPLLFHERLIAGAGARGIAQTCLHPIDVVRTRVQAKGVALNLRPQTFLKGVSPQFVLAFPAGALQFAAYEFSKARMAAASVVGAPCEILAGAIGATAASVIRVPQEVLKQRVQADIYPNAATGFAKIMKESGPRGFYKGYVATVSRDVPWNALSFMFFAQSKSVFESVTGEKPTTDQNLVLGAASGMAAAVIMTPVDVVKTRLMTGGATGGIPAVLSAIVREEGAATLMKGVVPRVAFLAPLSAITLSMYEAIGAQLLRNRLANEAKAASSR